MIPATTGPRRVTGMAAVLLPYRGDGTIDWPAFEAHVARTAAAGLVAAVNMDTGYVQLLGDDDRRRGLEIAADVCPGELRGGRLRRRRARRVVRPRRLPARRDGDLRARAAPPSSSRRTASTRSTTRAGSTPSACSGRRWIASSVSSWARCSSRTAASWASTPTGRCSGSPRASAPSTRRSVARTSGSASPSVTTCDPSSWCSPGTTGPSTWSCGARTTCSVWRRSRPRSSPAATRTGPAATRGSSS